jgi:hypothetical protein
VSLAILCTGTISGKRRSIFYKRKIEKIKKNPLKKKGAHMNPAISLAFAMWRPRVFPWKMWIPYAVSQLIGFVFCVF